MDDTYASQFERRVVGGQLHEELWVPAEELATFNRHITERITVIDAYFGAQFQGYIPSRFGMKGRTATEQFVLLSATFQTSPMDFYYEIKANSLVVYLHFPFWKQLAFPTITIAFDHKAQLFNAIEMIWQQAYPSIPLPNTS